MGFCGFVAHNSRRAVASTQPETVQYFQFDEEGNMFIYEAAAGCTGTPKLVRPGDELFLPSSNVTTKTKESDSSQVVDGHLFLVLVDLSRKNFSDETKKKIRWLVKMFTQWRAYSRVSSRIPGQKNRKIGISSVKK